MVHTENMSTPVPLESSKADLYASMDRTELTLALIAQDSEINQLKETVIYQSKELLFGAGLVLLWCALSTIGQYTGAISFNRTPDL